MVVFVVGRTVPVTPTGRLSATWMRWLIWSLIFLLGALGTKFVSKWVNDFVFTWHGSIFITF